MTVPRSRGLMHRRRIQFDLLPIQHPIETLIGSCFSNRTKSFHAPGGALNKSPQSEDNKEYHLSVV